MNYLVLPSLELFACTLYIVNCFYFLLFPVVTSLVFNGETLDEVSLAGRCRTAAIKSLCSMHPSRAAMVQSLAVTHCKHPTLALSIALEAEERKMK